MSGRDILQRLFAPGRRAEQRIATLRAARQTIELDDVPSGARVVEINLGYGAECWTSPPGPPSITDLRALAGGALILAAGRRASAATVRERGHQPEHVPTRI
jgi:hypothetical protein